MEFVLISVILINEFKITNLSMAIQYITKP
jgi:hypothetical protein